MGADAPRVVHADRELLVLEKPAGIPTTTPGDGPSLVALARAIDPDAPQLHPSSRLDAEVTGLVTFARTARANRALLAARAAGRYARCYVALAAGVLESARGEWTDAIAIDPRDPRRRVPLAPGDRGERGQAARSDWERVAVASAVTLLHVRPRTGRTHQIRVHAAHAGVPLFGDVHYGGPRRVVLGDGRVVTARRVMLHCARIRIPDVVRGGGAELELASEIPADVRRAWSQLGGEASSLAPTHA